MKFKNEIVLVTGSTRGLGRGIAEAFAQEGATVIINGTSEESVYSAVSDLRRNRHDVQCAVFDTADREAVFLETSRIREEIGSISILVNNAGISPKKNNRKVAFIDTEYDVWKRVIDVNINGLFNCCQAVLPDMINAKHGKIINIASAFARYYSEVSSAHYVTSKTAVLGLTRAISGEVCKYGINCNAVAPGRAWTEMTASQPKEVNDAFMSTIPAGRFASAKDISSAVLYLASENASYIHGATIDVNGGLCMV